MAQQHTPGKWKWVSGEKPCHSELIQARYEGDGEDSILYHGANWHMTPADKSLIEAAPELLEALKLAGIIIHGDWLELGHKIEQARGEPKRMPYRLQEECDAMNRIHVKVKAAIAKAEPPTTTNPKPEGE